MSISANILTISLPVSQPLSSRWLVVAGALLMVLACIQPWVATSSAATSLNVYDLAEWASLHPAVHAESPTLLTSFLLRLSIAWIALAVASMNLPLVFRLLVVFLTAFALLPPFEFLANTGSENYRQLLLVAMMTLFSGTAIVVLSRRHSVHTALLFVIGLACIGTSLIGTLRMVELLRGFSLPVSVGGGLVVYLLGSSLVMITPALLILQKRKQG